MFIAKKLRGYFITLYTLAIFMCHGPGVRLGCRQHVQHIPSDLPESHGSIQEQRFGKSSRRTAENTEDCQGFVVL